MIDRRTILKGAAAFGGLGLSSVASGSIFGHALSADSTCKDQKLVVIELTGGNDGLNTVVPFEDDVYGCDIEVTFEKWIREEIRFPNKDDLVAQIKKDEIIAKKLFDESKEIC